MADSQDNLLQKIKDQGDLVRKLKSAKESSEKDKSPKNSYQDFGEINRHLSEYSYICGYLPSKIDVELQHNLESNLDFQKYPYIKRWWYHMRSFSDSEIALLPVIHPSDEIMNVIKAKNKNIDLQVCDLLIVGSVV